MKNRKLFTQIFSSIIIVVTLTIITIIAYQYYISRTFYRNTVIEDLTVRAELAARIIQNKGLLNDLQTLRKTTSEISKDGGIRLTVIRTDGKVLSDSHKNPELMDNHAARLEIKKALSGEIGNSIRHSPTLDKDLIYVAVPLKIGEKIRAVVRASIPLSEFELVLFGLQSRLIWIGLIILFLTVFVSYIISRRVSSPLEKIQKGAEEFSKGDFSKPLFAEGSKEIVVLANSLNKMAKELDKRIKTISLQKSEQEAMFSSMKEGVLAINSSEEILNINQAALKFFQIKSDAKKVKYRHIYEVILNKEILDFIHKSLNTKEHLEEEITIYGEKDRNLLLNADPLSTTKNEIIGTIIVMNDITRVKEWDRIRQEFVANVSHELKTPITSIKGYVETLISGDISNKEIEKKFLKVINRQSNQLNAIIDDLLQLSKLDKTTTIELQKEDISPIIQNAVQCCPKLMEEKNIQIEIDAPENLKANVNSMLLERALVNLINNAVKYSYANGKVLISVKEKANGILIEIRDWGIGISKEHHSRLFERFYRVDKGRSREMGGTGLGLSIVKHIVLAHKGKISLESEPGKGSTFTIILPNIN
jgi:two-component system phosphate regulon sensor histidine kinase PhoR